jgi:TolA-binding protein
VTLLRWRISRLAALAGCVGLFVLPAWIARAQDASVAAPSSVAAGDTTDADAGVAPDSMAADAGGAADSADSGPGGGEAAPWAATTDIAPGALPEFLNTTDRRIQDERPAPTPEQIAALREMEAEVGRFGLAGTAYRDAVVSIVRREYLRQRRARDDGYVRQIREEERLQNEARDRAIRLFERFIANYPNDPTYTPDAMFRLGELYYERSALEFQAAVEAANTRRESSTGDTGGDEIPDPVKDFSPTIDLYRRLAATFPNYRRVDGVYYLIGYCLSEMNQPEEARRAFLALACANRFTYSGASVAHDPGEEPDGGTLHPSQTLDREPEPAADEGPFADPYEGCTPISQQTDFLGEVWLRIGEYHFDNDFGQHGLDRAISAYRYVLRLPEDRNYNLALYKMAWSFYRALRYPEALKHFADLVQWSDDEQARTGRAGTELRGEAIQYIAITFAYDDWNENQVPDPTEGQPTGFVRVQDPQLLPQDRPWTEEVYFQLGQVYFDEAKYAQAIEVWKHLLGRWPRSPRAPEVTNLIARAYSRANDQERERETLRQLVNFGVGSDWYNSNTEHPSEQRRAEQLAELAVINAAMQDHAEAQRLRAQCVANRDPSLCRAAQDKYRLAATGYRAYIQRYPNNPQAYELNYNLADTLYWSEDYEAAAREYASVRDSNLDDRYLSESARRVVESLKRLLDAAETNRQIELRADPPEPSGAPPAVTPSAMPALVQRLAQAREIYLARVDARADREQVRDSYDYNNTLLLYAYGYWPQARERFTRIFNERCSGPNANETGRVAWINLRNMAVALQQPEEAERLSQLLLERRCTFASDGTPPAANSNLDCARAENRDDPVCIAQGTLQAGQYRVAVATFNQAQGASGAEQTTLYERAASLFVRAVNNAPNDPQAPIALEQAAIALQRTSRFESAGRIYQRIIDEVAPRRGETPDEQARLDRIVSNAYFQLAYSAGRNFDYERAITNYRVLADSPRFATNTEASMVERREDALINVANILEFQQQYTQAATYWRRVADTARDAQTQLNAAYRVAEMSFKQRNWPNTVRDMRAFMDRFRTTSGAGELNVQAAWRIVEARRAQNNAREVRAGLQVVVDTFARSGQQPGSLAAEYAAQAKFELVDADIGAFENFTISPGRPATLAAYVNTISEQIVAGANQAKNLAAGYDPVPGYRRPVWTIAAFVRQGRIYELLARSVQAAATNFVTPEDMQRQMRGMAEDQRETVRATVSDRIRQVLDERTLPIECLAVQRYALAARAARIANADNEYTRLAIDRLNAYGEERIVECVAQANAADSSFAPATPNEFSRAPRGQTLDVRPDIAPPSFAPEDQ